MQPSEFVRQLDEAARHARSPIPGGGSMAWRIWGEGPALLLLHGGYGSWRHWARNIADLARDFTLAVPDMPGFGDSDLLPEPVRVDAMSQAVAAGAAEVLGQDARFGIVGFSFGSVIGGQMPRFAGGAVDQLIVVGFNRVGLWPLKRPAMMSWRKATNEEELAAAQRHNLGAMMIHDPALIDDLAIHLQTVNTHDARVRSFDIVSTHDMPARLQEVGAPVAGIWGARDVTLLSGPDDVVAAMRRLVPGVDCVVIDGAGHWVQFEAADRFNAAVREVVARAQSAAGEQG